MAAKCLTLDGSGDWVSISDHATLDLTGDMSISAWIKTSTAAYQGIFAHLDSAAGNAGYGFTVINDGKLGLWSNQQGAYTSYSDADTVDDGVWHQVGVTRDGTTLTFYIDGSAMADTPTSTAPDASAENANIGALGGDSPGSALTGLIDDVVVTNTILSAQNMSDLWNGGTGARADSVIATADMAGYWSFDDDSVADESDNTNNGTLVGNATYDTGKVPVATGGATRRYYSPGIYNGRK